MSDNNPKGHVKRMLEAEPNYSRLPKNRLKVVKKFFVFLFVPDFSLPITFNYKRYYLVSITWINSRITGCGEY